MKRMLKIAAVAAGVLVLAGCGNKAVNNPGDGAQNVREEMRVGMESKSGVINSIKDAMGLGKTMKCTYKMKNEAGGLESVTYVDGKKYMTEMAVAGKMQKMVFDGEVMYNWSAEEKKGTKINMACMKDLEKNVPETENNNTPKDLPDPTGEKTFEDAMDVKCEEASGADFSVPTDVVFTDQCEMMKNLMKNIPANIPNMPKNIPQGMPSGGAGAPGMPNLNTPDMNVSE